MPRLLILTSSFPGGPEDETCGYARQFARRLAYEFEVTVLAPADRRAESFCGEPYRLVRSSSLLPDRFNPFQSAADLNHLGEAGVLVKLTAAVALAGFFVRAARLALRADVICSHWLLPSGLIGALLSMMLRKPHVAIEHSGALHLLASLRGGKRVARFLVAGSRHVVVVSCDLRRKLVAFCPEADDKALVMPMGVEISRRALGNPDHSCSQSEPTVLFIGRLTEIKGVDVLIEALHETRGVRLVIAGDGPERKALEHLAARLPVRVEFLGRVSAARRDALLAACDVVVIPSRVLGERREGMPVVCLEAMAAGRCVIASRAGGLAEIVRDQHNGLLFEPGNARMLAKQLRRLLIDPALRARLGENARRDAADYAWPRVAARYARLIHESLESDATHKDIHVNADRPAC